MDAFHFELTEKWANILLDMVLEGKKKATCSSLASFEQEGFLPKEGEDDNLESWRNNHIHFFTMEGKEECHYEFSEDMPIVFEEFEVVYK